jgi:hypothetical protein
VGTRRLRAAVRADPRVFRIPSAVRRLEDSPATWWRARLHSPSRLAVVSAGLWRQLAEMAAVCRHRRTGLPDWLGPMAAETLPPEADTVRPADAGPPPPDNRRGPPVTGGPPCFSERGSGPAGDTLAHASGSATPAVALRPRYKPPARKLRRSGVPRHRGQPRRINP